MSMDLNTEVEERRDLLQEVTFFLGGKCNSNCTMCPSTDRERKMVFPEAEMVVYRNMESLPSDVRFYTVTGGEPTLDRKVFLRVMAALADAFPEAEAQLLTNGRAFCSKHFLQRLLEKCPPNMTVAIPIHGSTEDLHDQITRSQGGFKQTLQGIQNLLDRKVAVEIRIVITKQNKDDVLNIARLISKKFPDVCIVNFISLEVRGNCYKNMQQVYIDARESFVAAKESIDLLVSKGIDVGLYNYPLCMVDRGYWFLCKKSISPDKVRYGEICGDCIMKEACGGLFGTTLAIANPVLKAIEG